MCQTIFEKASPRQESQTVTCLPVTFNLEAQARSVFFEKEDTLNILNRRSTTVRGGVSEFSLTCTGGFYSLHETCGTCGTLPYFLCSVSNALAA